MKRKFYIRLEALAYEMMIHHFRKFQRWRKRFDKWSKEYDKCYATGGGRG